jgi:hypothetical protein
LVRAEFRTSHGVLRHICGRAATFAGNPGGMTMILLFVIFYLVASAWDVVHVNDLLDKMVNPGTHRQALPQLEAAPRLVIPSPAARRPIG